MEVNIFSNIRGIFQRKLSTRGGEDFEGEGFLFFVQCLDLGNRAGSRSGPGFSFQSKLLKSPFKNNSKTIETYWGTIPPAKEADKISVGGW